MKKALSFTLIVAVLLLAALNAFAGGQGEKGMASGQVTLLFWPGPESDAMQKVIDAYNAGQGKTDGVRVKQLLFSRQGFFDKELTDLAAASTQFDLNLVTTYTLGSYAPYLAPIDSFAAPDAVKSFIPSALDTLRFKGKLYGVPTDVSVHFLFYRSDLISRLQSDQSWAATYSQIAKSVLGQDLTPKDPADWTWNDYLATVLFFTKSINPDSPTAYGTVLQLKNLIFNIMIWDDVLASNGGNWLDAQGNVIINSPAAKASLQVYQTIIDNKATPAGSVNYEFPETNEAFSTGQAATALQWNAAFPILNDPKQSPMVAGKVGIAPIPAGSAGHKTHEHSLGIGLNNASKNKDDAGKFLVYLLSQDAMEIYAKAGGTPPVSPVLNAMASTRPDFSKVAEYLDTYGYVINGGTASYAVPVYQILADELSAVWAGQKSIDAALSSAASRMTSTISK
ncbi:MAG: ABC transporter substrate-binding protein [Spirochaetia bacterium]